LSGVKGLGATKVNSLVDAFNKPFMVGGLKRVDGTVRPASDLTASKEVSTSDRVDNQQQPEGSSRNGMADKAAVVDEEEDVERIGSPDWPSDVDDEDGEEVERPVARGREAVPSRSPSPESRTRTRTDGQDEVWRDPLDDDEDDDETSAPASKRRRES
jgi:DNA excision repair protein ERCC-1